MNFIIKAFKCIKYSKTNVKVIFTHINRKMACSKYQYVRNFETENKLEPVQWIVISLKPCNKNDIISEKNYICNYHLQFQDYMVSAAKNVMKEFMDIYLAYGYGDVFNFVFYKNTNQYKRRSEKLLTTLVSCFTSSFITSNPEFIKYNVELQHLYFEGSIYLLPSDQFLRDFLTNEQLLCHFNNLEITTVKHLTTAVSYNYEEASAAIKESSVGQKNELLFKKCGINYNEENEKLRKGVFLLRSSNSPSNKMLKQTDLLEVSEDCNKNEFWSRRVKMDSETKCYSKYSYLLNDFMKKKAIIPHHWLVIRIDGKNFHKFTKTHNFCKPNDERSLKLMNYCAKVVMNEFKSIVISYGHSDEYSFVVKRYNHREKNEYLLMSRIVSLFSSAFVANWNDKLNQPLQYSPSFDARVVLYPNYQTIRDYLSWRQVDCHINNMYNTCFWKLIELKGLSNKEAEKYLKGTYSEDKINILQNELDINYSSEKQMFRKGTIIHIPNLIETNVDLINDDFWLKRDWILEATPSSTVKNNE